MKSTIKLTGIKAEGKHGANPGEQDEAQAFILDIKVKLDVASDELDQTVDYQKAVDIARDHVANNSYKLIETLAYNIASEICNIEGVDKVSVSVHKPSAAKTLGVEDVVAKAKVRKNHEG